MFPTSSHLCPSEVNDVGPHVRDTDDDAHGTGRYSTLSFAEDAAATDLALLLLMFKHVLYKEYNEHEVAAVPTV